MPEGLVNVSYLGAIILFILALGGLSHQETARRGNVCGIAGMLIALLATIWGAVEGNWALLVAGTHQGKASPHSRRETLSKTDRDDGRTGAPNRDSAHHAGGGLPARI